ncbi:MAG TPA: Qat anti-phage system TatD family nuclease QatD [Roseiflexaceae bacterium]|nr:Qat anti-phage system TatD family nuclease QatD [Roseiflexaceae bacterium]
MIDFHCHIDLYPDVQRVLQECVTRNMYVLSVTTTPSAFQGTFSLASNMPRVRTALGLHPQLAHERKREIRLFTHLLPEVRYVGEIGLDGSPELKQHWDDQVFVFRSVLEACQSAGGRILSIHSRRAATEVLDYLERYKGAGTPVLHWFSGTSTELTRAITMGCWFSVGPAMVAGQKGRALVLQIPRDRILPETDGPFVQLQGRPAYPWDVNRVIEHLASTWEVSNDVVHNQLRCNLRMLVS